MYLLIRVILDNTEVMRLLSTILLMSHQIKSAYVEEYNSNLPRANLHG